MRLTDDYLFITDKKDLAIKLIQNLEKCAEKNKFSFNKDKLTTNFSYTSPIYREHS